MLRAQCPGCGKVYQAPEKFAGRKMRCKACSAVIEIPRIEAPPAAAVRPTNLEETAELAEHERKALEESRRQARAAFLARQRVRAEAQKASAAKKAVEPGATAPAAKAPKAPKGPKTAGVRLARKKTPVLDRRSSARWRQAAERGGETAAVRRTRTLLVAGAAAAVVLAGALLWYFLGGPGGKGPESTRAPRAARKSPPAAAKEPAKPKPVLPRRREPLELIPAESNVLLAADLAGLVEAWNRMAREQPAAEERLHRSFGDRLPAEDAEKLDELLARAGIDWRRDLERLHVGYHLPAAALRQKLLPAPETAPPGAPPPGEGSAAAETSPETSPAGGEEPAASGSEPAGDLTRPPGRPTALVLEGRFDCERVVTALQEEGALGKEPLEHGAVKLFSLQEPGSRERQGHAGFVSETQFLVTSEESLPRIAELLAGQGTPISSDGAGGSLKALAGTLERGDLLWAAFHLDEALPVPLPVPGAQPLEIAGGLVAFDLPEGGGVRFETLVACPSREAAARCQGAVQALVGPLALMAPPPLRTLLQKLELKVEEGRFRLALALTQEEMDALEVAFSELGAAGGIAPGLPGAAAGPPDTAGPEGLEGEPEEELEPEESDTGEEAEAEAEEEAGGDASEGDSVEEELEQLEEALEEGSGEDAEGSEEDSTEEEP